MKLEGKSLLSDFFKFIIPSIVAQWVFALYTMVDGIFVAKGVSATALTAVNISMPYIMALYAISIVFAVGTSTVVAILLGEKNLKKANQVFTQNIVLLIIFSIIITVVVMLNLEQVALFLGATERNKPYVIAYLKYIVPVSGLFILSYSFETLIKTDGYPKMATIIVTAGSVLNVILDYLFVMKLNFGISGAALGTAIAHVFLIGMYLFHFCGKKGVINFTRFTFDGAVILRELKNGISSGINELSPGLIIFLFNQAILHFLTEDALVSYTIIGYVNSLAVMTMVGIAQGYQPLISYHYGKGTTKQCSRLLRYGILAAAVCSIAFTSVCFIGAKGIVLLFLSDQDTYLVNYSVQVFRIFILSFLPVGFNVVIGAYFTAVEMPLPASIISLARGMVMIAICLFGMALLFGGAAIWWSPLVSELLSLVITMLFFIPYLKNGALH